jgi:DNA-binding NtrC family response regulator
MNVLHIEVPPLRERREDVPLLAYHVLKRYIEIDGTANIRHIHPAAMAMLERHEFTENNIRELENIILRAAGRCRGDTLRLPDIERAMELEPAARRPGTNAPPTAVQDWDPLMDLPLTEAKGQVRDWFTWEYIRRRLVECNGNITLASEKSGMLRPNFIREMRRVRITVEVALEARRRGRPELRAATEPEEDAD